MPLSKRALTLYVLIVCGFVGGIGLAAQSNYDQRLIALDDPFIDLLHDAYNLAGLVMPMEVQPLSVHKAGEFLDRLEAEVGMSRSMSDITAEVLGQDLADALSRQLATLIAQGRRMLQSRTILADSDVQLDFGFTLSPEIYLQSRAADAPGGMERVTGYKQRNALATIRSELGFGPVWGVMEFELKEDHNVTDYLRDPRDASNVPEQATYIDYMFPFRAVVNTGGDLWEFSIGRDRLELGNGHQGNLGVSDSPDFYDFARLQLGEGYLHYTVQWLSIEPWLDGFGAPLAPPAEAIQDLQKNAFVHRWDFSFWDKVHLGLTEGIMVGGIEPSLKFFNPLIVFHNLFPWLDVGGMMGASSFLGLELSAQPLRWLRLWYQYGMNQFQSQFERETYPDGAGLLPDSYGWLAGFELTLPLLAPEPDRAWIFELGLEYVFTNPWFYVRENALNSWFWRRKLASNVGTVRLIDRPIGWKYGPDSQVVYLWATLREAHLLDLRLSLELRTQGQNTILTPYEESLQAASLTTPSGIPEFTQTLGLEADIVLLQQPPTTSLNAPVFLPPRLSLDFGVWLVSRQNHDHIVDTALDWVDLQASAAIVITF